MDELVNIKITEKGERKVSARGLYKSLEVKKRFSAWFETNSKIFTENVDFTSVPESTPIKNGNGRVQFLDDYLMTMDMAKHIALMSGTVKGAEIRQYFIEIEKKAQAQLSMNDWYLIEDEKELREERKSKNARNYAMKLNAETRQMEARLKIAERVSDPIVRQRLINQLGYQMLEA